MKRIDRLMAKTELVPFTTCWIWVGSCGSSGYGHVKVENSRVTQGAHRAFYEELIGPIPPGLDLDHLCRNKVCVNPAHLEPVTRRENLNRAGIIEGINNLAKEKRKLTHCKRGHLLSGSNLYTQKNGTRRCKACQKIPNRRNK